MAKVIVEEYNPQWVLAFNELKGLYQALLDGLAVDIQHVGSTSVVGLKAKPVIDIDIIIDDLHQLQPVIAALENIGYEHLGDLGISGREAFRWSAGAHFSEFKNAAQFKHNLYVCLQGSEALNNHLVLRNYLRQHAEAARHYGELKTKLAEQFPYDIDAYVEGKTAFILNILKQNGFSQTALENIELINRKNG